MLTTLILKLEHFPSFGFAWERSSLLWCCRFLFDEIRKGLILSSSVERKAVSSLKLSSSGLSFVTGEHLPMILILSFDFVFKS